MSEVAETTPEQPTTTEETTATPAAEPVKEAATESAKEEAAETTPAETTPAEATPADAAPADKTEAEDVQEEEEELTVDLDALPKMRVAELKDILKALDLPTSGIKTTLIERIQEHFAKEDEEEAEGTEADTSAEPAKTEEDELLKEDTTAKPATDAAKAPEYIEIKKTEETKTPAGTNAAKTENGVPQTDDEKRKLRAEKFGLTSEVDKKEARAAKFGVLTEKNVENKKEERAAKFGIITDKSVQDKKTARADRFGTGGNKLAVTSADKAKDDDKLKKRAARFNLDAAPSAKTIKYDIQSVVQEKLKEGNTKVDLSPAEISLAEKKRLRALKFGA